MKVFSFVFNNGSLSRNRSVPRSRQPLDRFRKRDGVTNSEDPGRRARCRVARADLLRLRQRNPCARPRDARRADPHAGRILWLIRAEGVTQVVLPRKDIAQRLHNWFDLSSPAIKMRLACAGAGRRLGFVRLVESTDSGREKRVFLTAKGERFLLAMTARGRQLVQGLIGDLGPGSI